MRDGVVLGAASSLQASADAVALASGCYPGSTFYQLRLLWAGTVAVFLSLHLLPLFLPRSSSPRPRSAPKGRVQAPAVPHHCSAAPGCSRPPSSTQPPGPDAARALWAGTVTVAGALLLHPSLSSSSLPHVTVSLMALCWPLPRRCGRRPSPTSCPRLPLAGPALERLPG